MKFSIITPSFRSFRQLRLCVESVADQQGAEVEHLVQDSCSDDETKDWLPRETRVKAFIEKDDGMYDAINRGLSRAGGDILAYLNCDEQYLPGALSEVGRYFNEHPRVEVVFANGVVVAADGSYLCHRCALLPQRAHTLVSGNLAIMSCATFFRRRVVTERRLLFDTRYRAQADAYWALSLLEHDVPTGLMPMFTSTFTISGENLNFTPAATREELERRGKAPIWARALRPAIIAAHRLRKFLAGHYSCRPFEYAIYTERSSERRVTFQVPKPTVVWRVQKTGAALASG